VVKMRRKKFPSNHELRKKLIVYLISEGCSMFYIKLRLGYAFTKFERDKINSPYGIISSYERMILNDEGFREMIVDGLVENMLGEEIDK